jgi:NAD(P)H-hydrate repair Nnr-like enzyme with NAD(P)H-hydrate dehydratase domain
MPGRGADGRAPPGPDRRRPVEGAAALLQRPRLAAPARDAHKYSRGLVLGVGGRWPAPR